MSHESELRYSVRETDEFVQGWSEAVRNGHVSQMVAGSDLAGIKRLLAVDPYRVPLNASLVSDLRVITYEGRVRIWYYVVEDDGAVYLERVTIARTGP